MIVITGGAGFIGSSVVKKLNDEGISEIVIVDNLGNSEKWKNINGLNFIDYFNKKEFYEMVINETVPFSIETVIHMGACSSTTEYDADYLMQNNLRFSKELIKYCLPQRARFIYASSAATYGDGEKGYSDNEENISELRPLNMYGYSKQLFDIWLQNMDLLDKVAGLKFFNVYGPNEYHKGDMRSVVHKAYEQILQTGKVKLFKSYREDYKDGGQKRDFIYIKDIMDIIYYFMENPDINGLYNLGTGDASTWLELVTPIFEAVGKPVNIEFIEMPDTLKDKYQYFTQADITKLRKSGYSKEMHNVKAGVKDYVENYLLKNKYWGL